MPAVTIVNDMLPVDKAAFHYENAKKLLKEFEGREDKLFERLEQKFAK